MKKITYLLICVFLLSASVVSAQYGIGTDIPNASAALDISSESRGVLVPRLNSTQRDDISSPANALLIFNITNNTFEVFKTSCSCWVTVSDGGNTAAIALVNTAPVASNLNYSGNFIQGQTVTILYNYFDGQGDSQGLTNFTWQRASTNSGTGMVNIDGATGNSYTLQPSDVGLFVRIIVTPRASAGVLNGVAVIGSWVQVDGSSVPLATGLTVQGTTAIGSPLVANYTFTGGNGIQNTDPIAGTTFTWQSASDNQGAGTSNVSLYSNSAYTNTYTPQSDLIGRFVRVAVRVKDTNGLQAANSVNSPWVGPITASTEVAPVVSNVSFSPSPSVGVVHTASYSYFDTNFDPEGTSIFQWYRANDVSGTGAVAISGANAITYLGQAADAGKYLGFGVVPVALTGTLVGTEERFFNSSITTSAADFTFTSSSTKQFPYFNANRAMNAQNAIQVEVNVTTAGGFSISTPVVNGYSFSGNHNLNSGIQWITLQANGFQLAYNATGNDFSLTGIGLTTQTKTINIYHTKRGSDYTAHFNGFVGGVNVDNNLASYTSGETFSNNSACVNSLISASSCSGSVTGASGTVYPVVNINGQCWMTRNLNEVPSIFPSPGPWLNTTIQDIGQHGYYNTVTTNGSAGWATTAPTADHGRLYQWSAAMNGSILERAQGACPEGWHVPSDCELRYLEHGIGMSIAQQNLTYNNRGVVSQKLRSQGASFTNSSGFSLPLVGARGQDGVFSSNTVGTNLWSSNLFNNGNGLNQPHFRQFGASTLIFWEAWRTNRTCSVRCLKD